MPVSSQKAGFLLDCIDHCYWRLGLDGASGDDQVFADLVRARTIDPGLNRPEFLKVACQAAVAVRASCCSCHSTRQAEGSRSRNATGGVCTTRTLSGRLFYVTAVAPPGVDHLSGYFILSRRGRS